MTPNSNPIAAAEAPMPAREPAAAPRVGSRSLPVLRTIATIGAIQVLAMGFQLLRSKVVAVELGPSGVGTISLVDQVAALAAQISTFSLPFAAMKFLSAAHSESQETFARLYAAFVRMLLLISLAGTAVAVLVLVEWPAVLGPDLAGYRNIVILALLAIPATNLTALLTNTMAASRRVRASAIYGVWSAAALAVSCTAGMLLADLRGYYLGNLAALGALVGGGFLYLHRREGLSLGSERLDLIRELKRYPSVVSFAASLYVISFALPVAYLIARYAVLDAQGLEAAGLLQSAMAMGFALATVMRQSNTLLLTPMMNRVGTAEDKFRQAAGYLRDFSLVIAIVAVPLVLFADWWLPLLYSRRFLPALPYVHLFVLAQTIVLYAGVNLALLVGLDHIGSQVSITLCGLAALALLAHWLVPYLGIAGVALAMLLHGGITFFLSAWRLWVKHGFVVHRATGVLPWAIALLIAACGTFGAWLPSDAPSSILGKGIVCLALGAAGLRVLLGRERSMIRDGMER